MRVRWECSHTAEVNKLPDGATRCPTCGVMSATREINIAPSEDDWRRESEARQTGLACPTCLNMLSRFGSFAAVPWPIVGNNARCAICGGQVPAMAVQVQRGEAVAALQAAITRIDPEAGRKAAAADALLRCCQSVYGECLGERLENPDEGYAKIVIPAQLAEDLNAAITAAEPPKEISHANGSH